MILNRSFNAELSALNGLLGTDFGIISRILNDEYTVLDVASELSTINIGDQFRTVDTYCNEVVETNDLVTYPNVGVIRAMTLHPIYTAMQLEAYIGEPLHHHGAIVGTLNFSGFDPKRPDFSTDEVAKVKALAREIEMSLEP
jgi:GAF domain-containing protein